MSKIETIKEKIIRDFLGKGDYINVPYSKLLTKDKAVNIMKYSGLVTVVKRRSSKKIAKAWSKNFGKNNNYDSKIPAVVARHVYTTETILNKINLKNKSLIDLGAGEGDFLEIIKKKKLAKKLFGVEPSKKNCNKINKLGIKAYSGTIEDYSQTTNEKYDIATLLWTLCNCSNPLEIVRSASKLLNKNGYLIVAEGSRILVPFKKPMHMYFSNKQKPDMHPFHFSKNSLINLLLLNNLKIIYVNRYIDSEYLLIIAQKSNQNKIKNFKLDNSKKLLKFFKEWYKHSLNFKKEIIT